MTGRISVVAAALGAALFAAVNLGAAPAAGSCAPPIPLDQAIAEAPYVFVGTVAELRFEDRFAVFDVEDVWKGDLAGQALVNGGPSLADLEAAAADGLGVATSVDRTYGLGQRYLVVSHGLDDGVLLDNACSATSDYDDNLDRFRPATAYSPDPAPSDLGVPVDSDGRSGNAEEGGAGQAAWWVGGGATFILIGGVAAAVLRWRSPVRRAVSPRRAP